MTTSTPTERDPNYTTITLTDARPVRIKKDDWPIVASSVAYYDVNGLDATANMFVRENIHDGRVIVSASVVIRRGDDVRERKRGGILLDENADFAIDDAPEAIRKVAASVGAPPSLAAECVADLPPLDLD
jgi:hypothetical protein